MSNIKNQFGLIFLGCSLMVSAAFFASGMKQIGKGISEAGTGMVEASENVTQASQNITNASEELTRASEPLIKLGDDLVYSSNQAEKAAQKYSANVAEAARLIER